MRLSRGPTLFWQLLLALPVLQVTRPAQAQPFPATPQRPTFTSDTSTTAPGTLEFESGLTAWGGFLALPQTVKYTPGWGSSRLREMEFSLGFEALSSISERNERITEFGDRLALAVRQPLYAGNSISVAVSPAAAFFLRGDRGARLGATLHAACNFGRGSVAGNASWSAATASSESNPSQQVDLAVDAGYAPGDSGWRSRLGLFAGVLVENAKGKDSAVSLAQGVTYRLRPHWVLDLAVQQLGLAAGERDFRLLAGFTVNLGRPRDW